MSKAELHFPLVEHAAAAVHHQTVWTEILRKLPAVCKIVGWHFTCELIDPAGKLDRTDIIALLVMGTALGNQDPISVLQRGQCRRTPDGCFQTAFIPGKQNGK